jgi:hypothetical protein
LYTYKQSALYLLLKKKKLKNGKRKKKVLGNTKLLYVEDTFMWISSLI